MYSDDAQWLSQNIFTHRDLDYGSGGYIRVSMSTRTNDSMSFSAPYFVINIQNDGLTKSVSLSYQKIFELYSRLQEAVKAAIEEYRTKDSSPDAQLHFKTGKSTYLTIEFLRGSEQNEPVVRITISHGTSDSTKVLMPFSPEFIAFINLIGDMVSPEKDRKYLDWCLHFPNRYFLIEMNEIIKQIPGLVKTAVVQMDNQKESETSPTILDPDDNDEGSDDEIIQQAVDTMKELNTFIGKDMKNIELDIPKIGIQKSETLKVDPNDNRLYKWLGGDLKNFESILLRCCEKSNPIREFEKELNENYADMECFPGIDEKEIKSLIYLTTREYQILNSRSNESSLSNSFTINKYRGEKFAKTINIESAFDLLFLYIFIRVLRDKIENKTSDNYANKAILHLAVSSIVSPFIFSFIAPQSEVASVITNKFREMKNLGMLKSYENSEYKSYDCEITESDIHKLALKVEEFIKSDGYLSSTHLRHVALFNKDFCPLNPDHQLNEEQITKQLIPIETFLVSQNLSIEADRQKILEYIKENNIEDCIISLFFKPKAKKTVPILKFFETYIDEVPEECRDEFQKWIEEFIDKDYDLSDSKFPYDSFGEDAVKALYMWKPETGEKYLTYKKFQKAVLSSTHDKNTILSMIDHESETKGETFANFYVNAMGKR